MDSTDNKYKEKRMETAIEDHQTAAWINIEQFRGEARIFRPNILGAEDAKEYVDTNQK